MRGLHRFESLAFLNSRSPLDAAGFLGVNQGPIEPDEVGSDRPDHIIIRIVDFQESPVLDEVVTGQQICKGIDACRSETETVRISPVARDAARVDNC
jgi:hypothetical protein